MIVTSFKWSTIEQAREWYVKNNPFKRQALEFLINWTMPLNAFYILFKTRCVSYGLFHVFYIQLKIGAFLQRIYVSILLHAKE